MAATIITQNDLIEVINNSVKTTDILFKSITYIIESCAKITPQVMAKAVATLQNIPYLLKDLEKVMKGFVQSLGKEFFDTGKNKAILKNIADMCSTYIKITEMLNVMNDIGFSIISKTMKMKLLRGVIIDAIDTVIDISQDAIKKIAEKPKLTLDIRDRKIAEGGVCLLLKIIELVEKLTSDDIINYVIKLKMRSRILKRVLGMMMEDLNNIVNDALEKLMIEDGKNKVKTLENLLDILEILSKIFKIIAELRFFAIVAKNVDGIINALNEVNKLADRIAQMPVTNLEGAKKTLGDLKSVLWHTFLVVAGLLLMLPLMIVFILASPIILLCFWAFGAVLARLVQIISNSQRGAALSVKAIHNLNVVKLVLFNVFLVVASILLMLPLLLIFIIASPIILLCFWLFGKIINLIVRIVAKSITAKTVTGLLLMVTVIGIILLIAIMLVIISKIASDIGSIIGNTVGFLIGLIVITGIIAGLGWILFSVMTYLSPAIAGLMFIVIVIGIVLIIAVMLWLLQKVELDKEAVKKAVTDIMECVMAVIDAIFNSFAGAGGSEEGDPWYAKILSFMGGAVKTLLTSIMAIYPLALALISIGLILLLAKMLESLQDVHLEKDNIIANVKTVVESAMAVVDSLFNAAFGTNEEGGKSWFEQVLGFMGGTIKMLIGPIMAIQFLALSIVSIGLVQILARQLKDIESLVLDKTLIKDNIALVIECAMSVIECLMNPARGSEEGGDKPWYETVLGFMGEMVKQLIGPILAIRFLALSIVTIGLVQLLARQLKDIQDLELDAGAVKSKIVDIISAANSVIEGVFQKDNKKREQPKSLFSKLLRMALPDSMLDMMDALAAIGKLTLAWVAVGLVKNIAEALNTIMSFNIESGIHGKINLILNTAHSVVDTVLAKSGGDTKGLSKKISKVEDYLDDICDVMEELGEVVEEFNKIQTIEDIKMKSITNSTNHLISLVNNLVTGVKAGVWSVDKRLDQMGRLYKVIKDFNSMSPTQVKNAEEISKNYIALLDKIGTVDIENLKTTVTLFEKMAQFSESINGNFEGLAEALNEKIAPLLEKIGAGMDGLQESVEQSGADVSSSVYAASQGTLSSSDMKKQVGREMPRSSDADKNSVAQKRMQQQAAQQQNNLASKLDELIALFRSGRARVTT